MQKLLIILTSFVLLPISGFAESQLKTSANTKLIELNWLIAHEPVSVFERSAKVFKKKVEAKSNGQIKVNVITSKSFPSGERNPVGLLEQLRDGKFQMSQVYTNILVKYVPSYEVIELPFLFDSHEHVNKVFDGSIGKNLLASLTNINLKGLSFTYSGGFKSVVSTDPNMQRYEDLKRIKIRPWPGDIATRFFQGITVYTQKRNYRGHNERKNYGERLEAAIREKKVNSGEASYASLGWATTKNTPLKSVLETNHALFLTALVMNQEFYESQSAEMQKVISEAAQEAALIERQTSINDSDRFKKGLVKRGVKVHYLTSKGRAKWKKQAQPLYDQYNNTQVAKVISQIKKLKITENALK